MNENAVHEFAQMINPAEGEVLFFTTAQMMLYPRRPAPSDLLSGRYPAFACRRQNGRVQVADVVSTTDHETGRLTWRSAEHDYL